MRSAPDSARTGASYVRLPQRPAPVERHVPLDAVNDVRKQHPLTHRWPQRQQLQ
jgi:hypothetical protein